MLLIKLILLVLFAPLLVLSSMTIGAGYLLLGLFGYWACKERQKVKRDYYTNV